jgi:hypothetical protein
MREGKTHFEQIAVETVKRIATELPQRSPIENDGKSLEAQEEVMSSQKDWRQLAQQVLQEKDPIKTIELGQQLVEALEQEKLQKLPPTQRIRR